MYYESDSKETQLKVCASTGYKVSWCELVRLTGTALCQHSEFLVVTAAVVVVVLCVSLARCVIPAEERETNSLRYFYKTVGKNRHQEISYW